jgi:hypothetical protein
VVDNAYTARQITVQEKNQATNDIESAFNQGQTTQSNFQYYSDQIASMVGDITGNTLLGIPIKRYNSDQIRSYIASLPISEEEVQRLLDAYRL